MSRLAWSIIGGAAGLYILMLAAVYFVQERFIFFPQKLPKDYRFSFPRSFSERSFPMADDTRLSGILFPADGAKGLVFYLHGNAGSLKSWGDISGIYTDLGYDVLMLDYRGYGKSEGTIRSEAQLHADVRAVYDAVKPGYREQDIIILGYSIGTGPAAKLASESGAGRLILQAPYYNLAEVMASYYPFLPRFLLKYQFETNKYLPACRMPVVIFHGDKDAVIRYSSSLKLQTLFKPGDTLITLHGQAHNGISDDLAYLRALREILR